MSHVCSMRAVKHNGCDKQCVSGMSAPSSMMAFSRCYLYCVTSFDIDALL